MEEGGKHPPPPPPSATPAKKPGANRVKWTSEYEEAFSYIKEHLTSPDLLIFPDFNKPFILQTDASESGIGFVVGHEIDRELCPIMFRDRVLSSTETRYASTDPELLRSILYCEEMSNLFTWASMAQITRSAIVITQSMFDLKILSQLLFLL